jgi:hypothetical protein
MVLALVVGHDLVKELVVFINEFLNPLIVLRPQQQVRHGFFAFIFKRLLSFIRGSCISIKEIPFLVDTDFLQRNDAPFGIHLGKYDGKDPFFLVFFFSDVLLNGPIVQNKLIK